jgi:hypothetical protein
LLPRKKPSDSKTPKTNINNQNNHKNHQQKHRQKQKQKGKGSGQEICTNLMEVWEQLIYKLPMSIWITKSKSEFLQMKKKSLNLGEAAPRNRAFNARIADCRRASSSRRKPW